MRSTQNLNRRHHHRRCAPMNLENSNQSKSAKRRLVLTIKGIKLLAAILVPIMIGIFTIITTLNESKQAQIQRESDMEKIERQAQLQREIDSLKMKEQQEYEENNQKEIRIQTVYDTFIRDMSSIAMKEKINLTLSEVIFARAKTLVTLEQIDSKRKWYLIKFLYDSQLLYANRSGMKFIDLAGADLSNVPFHIDEKFARRLSLENIRLCRIQLRNSSFRNLALNKAYFQFSAMNYSKFFGVSIISANFEETLLDNAELILFNLQRTTFRKSQLRFSSWSSTSLERIHPWSEIDFSNCDLTGAIFKNIVVDETVNFNQAIFERMTFSNVEFSAGRRFEHMNMSQAKFIDVKFIQTQFLYCDMFGTIFERSNLIHVTFDHVDLRHTQFNDLFYSDTTTTILNSNLIGSNLNFTRLKVYSIKASLLPNRTFVTSFKKFGLNLLTNGDAEEGSCQRGNQSSIPTGWIRLNDVFQMTYNNSKLLMNMTNLTGHLGTCFFIGGTIDSNARLNIKNNRIEQAINLEELSVLFDYQEARYIASAYLGGFDNELSTTSMIIQFKNKANQTISSATVGRVSNDDRLNRTMLLFCSTSGWIPKMTVSVNVQLLFQRLTTANNVRAGMADNLKLIIQQK